MLLYPQYKSLFIDFCVSRTGYLNMHPCFFQKGSGFILTRNIMAKVLSSSLQTKENDLFSQLVSGIIFPKKNLYSSRYQQSEISVQDILLLVSTLTPNGNVNCCESFQRNLFTFFPHTVLGTVLVFIYQNLQLMLTVGHCFCVHI